jgi:predicted dehydrogenase
LTGIGILGAGYWGPKHVRNFSEIPGARVTMVADLDEARLRGIVSQYRDIRPTTDYLEMLGDPETEGVVIVTPVRTHFRLAREALMAGKHVLVEKPLAASSAECEELVELAARFNRVLMVGHTFLYNPAVEMLRELVLAGELGEVYCAHAQRLNLGLFQRDINVIWDLAPHDISILMYVLGADPISVAARAHAHVKPGIEDVANMDLAFPDRVNATVHVSWLDPNKVRRLTIVGSRKMAVYDDVEFSEKIRIFDKGADLGPATATAAGTMSYRQGGISSPPVPGTEPLRLECQHFIDCIRSGAIPRTSAEQGLKVVRVLETADASVAAGGAAVAVPATVLGDAIVAPWAGELPALVGAGASNGHTRLPSLVGLGDSLLGGNG